MTVTPAETDDRYGIDSAVREIFDMEVNERRILPRDATPQAKVVIRSVDAIAPLPVLHISEAVKEQLEESYRRFQLVKAEPIEIVAPVRSIPKALWPSPPPVVVTPPPIVEESKVSPIIPSPRPKIPSQPLERPKKTLRQPRERRPRVNWQQGLWPSSKTGVKGVSRDKGGWRAQITRFGVNYRLGFFEDKFDAARAYDAKAIELFGPDARTNASLGLIPLQEVKKPPVEPVEVTLAPAEPISVSPSIEAESSSQPVVQGIRRDSTSGCKGCCWYPSLGKWRVTISKDRKQMHIGYFSDLLEAALTYDKTAKELFGDDAELNFPSGIPGTSSEIKMNRVLHRDSTSGCKGCSWYPSTQKWRVQIDEGGRTKHLGYFVDLAEAARVYDAEAVALFGDRAVTNASLGLIPAKPQEPVSEM
jgi:hypothetical protein